MRSDAGGVLVIWNDIDEGWDAEFQEWHVREHMPERVGLPGFLRGQRYVAIEAKPRYFNFYEARDAAVFSSQTYRERLNNPTPWTRKVVAHFANTARTICNRVAAVGRGDGAFVETVRFSVDAGARMRGEFLDALVTAKGVVAATLMQGAAAASAGDSAEKKLRSQPDQLADWVLVIEAVTPASLLDAKREVDLRAAGALPGWQRGVYQLQFALTQEDGRTN